MLSVPNRSEASSVGVAPFLFSFLFLGPVGTLVRKVKNSQARTGHQRGMDGRETDDDDTLERHTDTNKLTGHTARLVCTHTHTPG